MSRTEKHFLGRLNSPYQDHTIKSYCTRNNSIFIEIKSGDGNGLSIYLDIDTAIQFAKQLRTEINIAKQ